MKKICIQTGLSGKSIPCSNLRKTYVQMISHQKLIKKPYPSLENMRDMVID